jgi:uncharacterized SAM-binding protein YcdF (DUF218 family)
MAEAVVTAMAQPRRWRRRLMFAASALIALILLYYFRAPVLEAAARWWVVEDVMEPADAIVVLGGGIDTRPFAAADMFRRGLAPQVLIANVRLGAAERLELAAPHTRRSRDLLVRLGVPAQAISEFGDDVSNTYEEAKALVAWVRATRARRVIVASDAFPSRRVRWLFRRELEPFGVRVLVNASAPADYPLAAWWRDEKGIVEFQNEGLKYLYYRVKYWS